jgi:cytochrome c2
MMNRILPIAIVMLVLAALPFRAMAEPGNTTNGERMFRACVACHSLEPNRNMTGPSLAEIWNRRSGSLASFPRYSPALKAYFTRLVLRSRASALRDQTQCLSWRAVEPPV